MDTTIRNIDEKLYRALKARAAETGRTLGETLNDAIRAYLAQPALQAGERSLRDLVPEEWPEGSERSSEEVDAILARRSAGQA
jgi:hypothetical protein